MLAILMSSAATAFCTLLVSDIAFILGICEKKLGVVVFVLALETTVGPAVAEQYSIVLDAHVAAAVVVVAHVASA